MGKLTIKIPKAVLLVLTLSTLGPAEVVLAQEEGGLSGAWVRMFNPDAGVLFFNVTLREQGGKVACYPISVNLMSDTRSIAIAEFDKDRLNLFSWDANSLGTMKTLQPGTWTMNEVKCRTSMGRVVNFKGPVAQIHIGSGQVVDAGNLVLELSLQKEATFFENAVFGHRAKVEPLSPEIVAALRAKAPETFAKAKQQFFATAIPSATAAAGASPSQSSPGQALPQRQPSSTHAR